MNGQIDWTALPVIVEILGIQDVEFFIRRLMAIREHLNLKRAMTNG